MLRGLAISSSIACKRHAQLLQVNSCQPAMFTVLSPDEARQLRLVIRNSPIHVALVKGIDCSRHRQSASPSSAIHPLRQAVFARPPSLCATSNACQVQDVLLFSLHKIHSLSRQTFSRHFRRPPMAMVSHEDEPFSGSQIKIRPFVCPRMFYRRRLGGYMPM